MTGSEDFCWDGVWVGEGMRDYGEGYRGSGMGGEGMVPLQVGWQIPVSYSIWSSREVLIGGAPKN